jgi:hypothetical protein
MNATLEHAFTDDSRLLPDAAREEICIQDIIRRHHDSLIKFLRRRLSIADDDRGPRAGGGETTAARETVR